MKNNYKICPLSYNAVKLAGDMKRQFDETAAYYYGINNNDMLKPYRERAGQPALGRNMGGVYIGHSPFGQYLGGFARMYGVSGDAKYKEKAVFLMDEWAKTIESDGFFFDKREPHLCAYIYEKLLGGLLDIYYFCKEPRALTYLKKITLWEMNNVSETREYCDVVGKGTGEWYTQSENLYRAYLYTGDEIYRRYAETWEYTEYWDEILKGDWPAMYNHNPWHHAYSHVNTFCGAAMAYIVKKEEKYLNILKAAYDFLQKEQCYATGGFGGAENLSDRDSIIEKLRTRNDSFETQCGSWAGFKLSKYLLCFTGEAKYADWTEKLIINGIGASLPTGGTGSTFYYSEYRTSGAHKRYYHSAAWPCCSGTRPQAIAEYANLLYFTDNHDVYIAQYFDSEGKIKTENNYLELCISGDYPRTDTVSIVLRAETPEEFAVKFRIPGWLTVPAEVAADNEPMSYDIENGWGILRKKWSGISSIKIRFPMEFRAEYMFDDDTNPYAIVYGPTVMAVRSIEDMDNPVLLIDPKRLNEEFDKVLYEYCTWEYKSNKAITIKPFYLFRENEEYYIYLDKEARQSVYSFRKAAYDEGWEEFGGWRTAFKEGLSCSFEYDGGKIALHAFGFPDCGIGDIYIDGQKAGELDCYAPEGAVPVSTEIDRPKGKHSLRLVCSGRKNSRSANIFINIAKFELL